jgi:hypothetical protein
MHGNVSRSKRRSATAEDWLTPQQQFEKALELFQSAPEDREECKSAIALAIRIVQDAKKAEAKAESENKPVRKKDWDNAIKKLRAVEIVASRSPRLIDKGVIDTIREERIFLECFGLPKIREMPFDRRSRYVAAFHAWTLLGGELFNQTGLTEGGIWHQLAAILFGYPTTDLFNFDCLKRIYSRTYKAAARRRRPKRQKV